ncbi:MAG TPA: hypothetical protein VGO00_15210 [Kofleriaceae bacterium]|jgi:hypothetical protein|nr:hypothetical protein [Kofleriaceae bacterium]
MTKSHALASCLLISACGLDAATTDPVATFSTRTGSTIEVYAFDHGYAAMERAEIATATAVDRDDIATLSPSALYAKATGDATVPPALDELTAALTAGGATFDGRSVQTLAAAPVTPAAAGACTAAAFQASFCPFGDYSWCLLNHTDGAFEDTNVGNLTKAYLCMKSGNATWEIENGDGGHHVWSILEGQQLSYWFHTNDLFGTYCNYTVENAKNNTFQFGGFAN